MDAGRRHETSGSDIKGSLLLVALTVAVCQYLCLLPEPSFSQGVAKRTTTYTVGCVTGEEPQIFYNGQQVYLTFALKEEIIYYTEQ